MQISWRERVLLQLKLSINSGICGKKVRPARDFVQGASVLVENAFLSIFSDIFAIVLTFCDNVIYRLECQNYIFFSNL